jgi:hypothetical protein
MPPKRGTARHAPPSAPYPDVVRPTSGPRQPRNRALPGETPPADPAAPVIPPSVPTTAQYDLLATRLDSNLQDLRFELRQTVNDTFNQVMERLDTLVAPTPAPAPAPTLGSTQPVPAVPAIPPVPQPPALTAFASGNSPDPFEAGPHNVLSRWKWVDTATITAIATGRFDITSLPKLFRSESVRTRLATKEVEGWNAPAQGGDLKLIVGRTKFATAFKDLPSFLSAWLVYCSIRSTYSPEHGPGLNMWTERIVVYASTTTLPWSAVLDYIIAYFQEHQPDPPAYWYRSDTELVSLYLSLAHAQIVNTSNTSSGVSKAQKAICNNYNRPVDACKNGNNCPRSHICKICHKQEHRAPDCPRASSAT